MYKELKYNILIKIFIKVNLISSAKYNFYYKILVYRPSK